MQTKNIPSRTESLSRNFFARDAESVAKDLLGRLVVHERRIGNIYAIIHEVAAYEGEEDSSPKGIMYSPGTILTFTSFGKKILGFGTKKICEPSCVIMVGGEVYDDSGRRSFVQGPGNLTRALGIVDDSFDEIPIYYKNSLLWITGEPINPEKIIRRNKSNVPRNCRGYFYFR